MLRQSLNLFPNIHIILYEVPKRKDPESKLPGFEKRLKMYNQIMSDLCRVTKNVTLATSTVTPDTL